jgi:hypothetical protein
MPSLSRLIGLLVVFGLSILSSGCGTPPVEITLGNTFSNYNNQFKVLSADRYSQSHTNGDYVYYDEVVFVVLEWKCLRQPGQRCTTGGYQFSLVDKEGNSSFENMTFKDQVINQFHISVPTDAFNCCDLIDGGDTYHVYLLFAVDCSKNLVLKYPDYSGESESDSLYYAELPDRVQCKR